MAKIEVSAMTAKLLAGKVALVTGASRGIGRAIAQRLASAGATVVLSARSVDKATVEGTLQETEQLISAAGGKALLMPADLLDGAQRDQLITRVVAATGGLDILVNNAGYAEYAPTLQMSDDVFEHTLDHYLRAPLALVKAAVPHLRQRGAGWIINLGSVTAEPIQAPFDQFSIYGGVTVYAMVKAAAHRLAQGLAAELSVDNIAVNILSPSGAIRTPGAARYIPDDYPTEPIEYIAETALALCSLPPAQRSGLIAYSMQFPVQHKLPVYSLDGRQILFPA
jgi:NAD(P)-dependent dehydrogenase (short-subunit alcohol dehydrogenase family)